MSNLPPQSGPPKPPGGRPRTVPPPPRTPTPKGGFPPASGKTAAEKEEQDLYKKSVKEEHGREQKMRSLLASWMRLAGLIMFVAAACIFTLGWHLVTGAKAHWLDPEELQRIKDFILSGAVVGLGTHYARRYLEPPNNSGGSHS